MMLLPCIWLLLIVAPVAASTIELPVIEHEPTGICYEIAVELNIAAHEGIITYDEAHQVINNCINSGWASDL